MKKQVVFVGQIKVVCPGCEVAIAIEIRSDKDPFEPYQCPRCFTEFFIEATIK